MSQEPQLEAGATLGQLVDARRQALAEMQKIKNLLTYIDEQIAAKIDLVKLFDDADKTYGDITATIDGFKVKAEISKTVSWDSDKLVAAARGLPWSEVNQIFDVKFGMAEKKYSELAVRASSDPASKALMMAVNDARTLKFGAPKIKSIETAGE